MKRFVTAGLCSLFAAALAAQPSTDWTAINLAVTDAHVIPSYNAFAVAAEELNAEAAGFCVKRTPESLSALQTRFNAALDGWQGVQHLQFGPITYFNWNYRIQYWPDDKGTGARQMSALLAAQDAAVLAPETFARQSVGVQGFQALESLLFDATSLADLQADPYRCQVVQTIAANIAAIATGVATRWESEFRATVASADERGYFESAQDATIDYLKALVESVRRIQQQKLEAVLGATPEAVRVRRAESWRAQRSLRNLKLNVDALEQLYSASVPPLSSVLQPADVEVVDAAFAQLQGALAAQPDSLTEALAREGGHAALLGVAQNLDALFEALEAALKNTDLYLGFNSLDGD